MTKNSTDSSETDMKVALGDFYDLELDSVKLEMECLSCLNEEDESNFFYNETLKAITVRPSAPAGNYKMRVVLTDDNEVNSLSQ